MIQREAKLATDTGHDNIDDSLTLKYHAGNSLNFRYVNEGDLCQRIHIIL